MVYITGGSIYNPTTGKHEPRTLNKILLETSKETDQSRLTGQMLDITQLYLDSLMPDRFDGLMALKDAAYKTSPAAKETWITIR